MTNSEMLGRAIVKSGYKKEFIAEKLGNITLQTLFNKINNRTEFKASEIVILTELLELSPEDQKSIFFNQKVDEKE